MSHVKHILAPGTLSMAKRWLLASSYTFLYGIPELLHLATFNLIRRVRAQRPANERLIRLEQEFLNRADWYHRQWSHIFCSTFGITVHVENRCEKIPSNERIVIAMLNQQSILDAVIFSMIRDNPFDYSSSYINNCLVPYSFALVNIEFALLPFIGWNAALTGVTIQRNKKTSTQAGLQEIIYRMRTFNDSFSISPEGKRSLDGRLSVYKKGVAIMAIETQSVIVPITFHNTGKLWPHGDWQVRPGNAKITIHRSISTKGMALADKDILTQRLRNLAEEELNGSRNSLY